MRGLATLAAIASTALACDGELRFAADTAATDDAGAEAAVGDAAQARCSSDVDCPLPGLHCETSSGSCVACVIDANCNNLSRPRCDSALHACVECGSSQDCGFAAICEPSTRKCLHKCRERSDCPAGTPWCNEGAGVCVECASASDCPPARRYCEKASGRCIECRADSDCAGTRPRCDVTISRCVQCLGASDCRSSAPTCDPVSSTCVAP